MDPIPTRTLGDEGSPKAVRKNLDGAKNSRGEPRKIEGDTGMESRIVYKAWETRILHSFIMFVHRDISPGLVHGKTPHIKHR